jgi:hypothetical protein
MPDDSRFEEIMRRIQQRKAQEAAQSKQDTLADALDAVNALGLLESIKKRPPAALSAYGPKVFSKVQRYRFRSDSISSQSLSEGSYWTGAVLWYKPKGYGQYETLTLLGIWAIDRENTIELLLGTKQLAYNMPLFNPESYYYHLRRGFSVLYDGDASPPDGQPLYQTRYQPQARLTLRAALEAAVQSWRESQR